MMLNNGFAASLRADIVASRFELLLFAVSLIGYLCVFASRRGKKGSKDINCEADFVSEVLQVAQDEPTDQTEHHDSEIIENSTDLKSDLKKLLDAEQFEEACSMFEMNYSDFFDMDIDEDMEQQLLMSALKCGRQSLAEHVLQTSQTDFTKNVTTIQTWWKRSAARQSETRVGHMQNVLDRMAQLFTDMHPFEEDDSDGESTCALGGDDIGSDGDQDSNWDDSELWP